MLNDADYAFLERIPEPDLVDAAADLGLAVPETIDRRELMDRMLTAIIQRAHDEGLPFSKYDKDDLEALDADERAAIATLQGLRSDASVRAMLKAGQKVYKWYRKVRPNNPVALLLPTLLPYIARAAQP